MLSFSNHRRTLVTSISTSLRLRTSHRNLSTPARSEKDHHSSFSIALAFDESTGGVVTINQCRKQLAAKFGLHYRPTFGRRLFVALPLEHFETCQEIVRELCAQQQPFSMELGKLFIVRTNPSFPPAIRWQLIKSEELVALDIELMKRLAGILGSVDPATKDIRSYLMSNHVDRHSSVKISTSATMEDPRIALAQIQLEYGNRLWTVKADSVTMWQDARKHVFLRDPIFFAPPIRFPFRKS